VAALLSGLVGLAVVLDRDPTEAVLFPLVPPPSVATTDVPRTSVVPRTTTPTPTTNPLDGAADVDAVAALVSPAVVDITTNLGFSGSSGRGAGTGMVITASGEVLTNYHVVAGATAITLQINGQGTTYTAKIVGTNRTEDVAVLQIDGVSGLATVQAGRPTDLAIGDAVVAIGNAGGRPGPPTVTSGTVSALNQTATAADPASGTAETLTGLIQTTAPLQPGDSGGPLINGRGQVVGMNAAAALRNRSGTSTPVSFAIPITRALAIAADIRTGRASSTVQIGQPGYLGVQVNRAGVVTRVVPGLPAEAAGMEAGDTIVAVDDKPIDSSPSLTDALSTYRAGDRVNVTWIDQGGQRRTASIRLSDGTAS
jgi:S1-C subfamily serine protease